MSKKQKTLLDIPFLSINDIIKLNKKELNNPNFKESKFCKLLMIKLTNKFKEFSII